MKKTAIFAVALVVLATQTARAGDNDSVDFGVETGSIKQAVIDALANLNPPIITTAPTEAQMLLIERLYARSTEEDRRFEHITGLEYAKNLTELYLGVNKISDISPILNLTKLTDVVLEDNNITDIAPLRNLENLRLLYLNNNNIEDIGLFSNTDLQSHGFPYLTKLWLTGNMISDIEPLSGLKSLENLQLAFNAISDLKPLESLKSLVDLSLSGNPVDDDAICSLSDLSNLEILGLEWGTNVSDLTPLASLTKLRQLQVGYLASDLGPLENLVNLEFLWVECEVSDISPLSTLMSLKHLNLRCNPLNEAAYCIYIPMIEKNNPGIEIFYDTSPYGACDSDGDGVLDQDDECPDTPEGSIVDEEGCSIAQRCPCNSDWKNHGTYVSCVAQLAFDWLDEGLLTEEQTEAIISEAAQSDCGKKTKPDNDNNGKKK